MTTNPASPTKGALSPARRRLVELMQEVNFGRIESLCVRDAEPLLEPAPRVLRDARSAVDAVSLDRSG